MNNNFNISNNIGDIFFETFKLDSLQKIQKATDSVFCNSELSTSFRNKDFWLLFQRRNLIVHRRGVVDQAYIGQTSDNLPIGSRLLFNSSYAKNCLILVRDFGVSFVNNCDSKWREGL